MPALPSRPLRVQCGLDPLLPAFDIERLLFDQFPPPRGQLPCPFEEHPHILADRFHAGVIIDMRQSGRTSATMAGLTRLETDDGHGDRPGAGAHYST